jgi:hypothetical protein
MEQKESQRLRGMLRARVYFSPVWRCSGRILKNWSNAPNSRESPSMRRSLPIKALFITLVSLALGATLEAQVPPVGKAVAWGGDSFAQTDVPSGLLGVVAVASGGHHTVALRADGTVAAWGWNLDGQINVPDGLSDVVAVAAGFYHSLALKNDGSVVAWGNNGEGQVAIPAEVTGVAAVGAGWYHNLAVKHDGSVAAWGQNAWGQASVPVGLSNVKAVAAGWRHSLALKNDGTVVAWGDNQFGQTDIPSGLSEVMAVAAGGTHCMALKTDGTLVAWGGNSYGESDVPVGLTNVVAVAAFWHTVALKSDGSIVAWGLNDEGQANVPGTLSNAFAVAAGRSHSVALVSLPASLSLDPERHDAPAVGGDFAFDVAASGDWNWSLEGGVGWVTTSESAAQSGDQTFSYSVDPNAAVMPRDAMITLTSGTIIATHQIHQAGSAPAIPTVSIRGPRTVRTTKPKVTLRGTAADANGDLIWVRYRDTRAKGARWRSVQGVGTWSAVAVLGPRRVNTVQLQAGDVTGLRSQFQSVRFLRR